MASKETAEYEIKLQDKLTNPLQRATGATKKFDSAMGKTQKSTSGFMAIFKGNLLSNAISSVTSSMVGLVKESITIGAQFDAMEKAIRITSGSSKEFDINMNFLKQTTGRLGLDLMSASKGFNLLSAATMGTSLQGEGARHIFQSVASATAKLGVSADDTKGIFLALGQMVSKGKVSAEELNGQLGERMPGALGIAADAMGVSTKELMKMMQQGELMSETFLPKFAQALNAKFGDASTNSVNTMTANLNRLNAVFVGTMASIGKSLEPVIQFMVDSFAWISENMSMLQDLAMVIGIATGAWLVYTVVMGAVALVTAKVTIATKLMNFIMALNPIGLIVIAVAALVAGFVVLWHTNKKVRTTFTGLWESIKKVGTNIKSFVVNTFKPFLEAWDAFKDGDYGKAAKSIGQGFMNISPVGLVLNSPKLIEGVGDAYTKGKTDREQLEKFRKNADSAMKAGKAKSSPDGTLDDFIKAQAIPIPTGPGANDKKKKEKSTSVSGVSSGRPTTVNIDIGKLIENFNITSSNLEDMEIKVKNAVSRALVSAVNDVNLVAR